jgi:hypothetical protein
MATTVDRKEFFAKNSLYVSGQSEAPFGEGLPQDGHRLRAHTVQAEEVLLGLAVELGEVGVPGGEECAGRRSSDSAGEPVR